MSAKAGAIIAALLCCGCAPPGLPAAPVEHARTDLAAACGTRDGWSDPAPPAQIFGNVWDVGTCGITVLLVTSPAGHILIDSGPADAAGYVTDNILSAGFEPRDVRWIVMSHEHNDHVGGFAALKAATGARIAARAVAARALAQGQVGPDDPQAAIHQAFPPVQADRILEDGETLALGPLRLTMHLTPVHSPGSASWTFQATDGQGKSATISYADSLTTIAADGYRFADHADRVAAVRSGLATAASLPCGILVTPHPGASNLFERLAGRAPLEDAAACRTYAEEARARFEQRLAGETAK